MGGEAVYELVGIKPPERIDDAATIAPRRAAAGSEHVAATSQHTAPSTENHSDK